ncbi:DUF5698 domain-containing protein [Nitriliruptor alkaliphilus]|uniref:DUF5698 domain-containing protein n=1 Tax=Nitriliruptor alkaliphilus TaxID=427918 RepID=UPI0006986D36|nr:DUF5698 domain-containing protein [Nitriliruptor alkaliphilus]
MDTISSAALIACAAALTVSLWTLRVALAARGRRVASAIVAGGEAVLFVVVFSRLLDSLGDPVRLAGYAVGVGLGTLVGLTADERLSGGQSEIRLVVSGPGTPLVDALHAAGWPVTATVGCGPSGAITSLSVVVDDRRSREVTALVDALAPGAFLTVERLRRARPVPLPAGLVQVGGPRGQRAVGGRRRRCGQPSPKARPTWHRMVTVPEIRDQHAPDQAPPGDRPPDDA